MNFLHVNYPSKILIANDEPDFSSYRVYFVLIGAFAECQKSRLEAPNKKHSYVH